MRCACLLFRDANGTAKSETSNELNLRTSRLAFGDPQSRAPTARQIGLSGGMSGVGALDGKLT